MATLYVSLTTAAIFLQESEKIKRAYDRHTQRERVTELIELSVVVFFLRLISYNAKCSLHGKLISGLCKPCRAAVQAVERNLN